ncbi:MAG TPA: type II toxin-antitoxin system VapC family toxin [Allocoleopsis sp.]
MIVLDTHIWIWWVHRDAQLPEEYQQYIQEQESQGLGISAISCWEVAKLVERGRLNLPCPIDERFAQALAYPGMQLLELTPKICVESTQLPGDFHRDPDDQIIVATARVWGCPLVTMDSKILNYSHVQKQPKIG